MSEIPLIFLSIGLVSAASLIGVFALSMREALLRKVLFMLVALATGAMFGNVLLHLLPEAYELSESRSAAGLFVMLGILAFFALEKVLRWQHSHAVGHEGHGAHLPHQGAQEPHEHEQVVLGPLVLTADALHNLLDGFIIVGGFLVSPAVGIATTAAVILHELPQEIGDFGLLLHAGYTRAQALLWNFASALTAFAGAGLGLYLASSIDGIVPYLIAFAAGNFLYIAGSDLLPELRKTTDAKRSVAQLALVIAGVLLMAALIGTEAH